MNYLTRGTANASLTPRGGRGLPAFGSGGALASRLLQIIPGAEAGWTIAMAIKNADGSRTFFVVIDEASVGSIQTEDGVPFITEDDLRFIQQEAA
jgi:hypothetical protein